jgi:outer membrane receptor for ferrienterochelin and colicins
MRQIIFSILLFCVSIHYAFAQKAEISGKVLINGKAAEGVNVYIPSLAKGILTNSSGGFLLKDLPAGDYQLRISFVGYKTINEQVSLKGNETLKRDFILQEDPLLLSQVVVTATRNEIPQYSSPIIVSKISNRTFEATQSLSLSEGLSFSPGLRLENNCQNCGFTQLRMNGLEGPYSQILINSRPVFSALAGVYGLDMIPANMIDRIEVMRGGGSVLYGGNAIAGTVNIITKEPTKNSFQAGMNQSFVNLESPDRTLHLNGSLVNKSMNKGISFYAYNRNREPWDANDDGFSEIALLNNKTFGIDAFWNLSQRSKLKLTAHSISEFRRGGNKFDLEPHQTDITEQLAHRIKGISLSWEQYSKNLKHKISLYSSAQFIERDSYYGSGGRVLSKNDTLTPSDILALNAYGQSKDLSAVGGFQYTYDISKKMILSIGSEYQLNDVKDAMPGYDRSIKQRVNTIGTYAQLELKPTEKITLLLGGRFDDVSIDGQYDLAENKVKDEKRLQVAVPRVSAMYNLSEYLRFRTSFAQGYRAPQAFDEDLHIETVGGAARFIRLADDLKSERSNSLTASLNYTKSFDKKQFNFVIESFYTELNNPFILSNQEELPNGTSVITKRNGDAAVVKGLNLEANIAFGNKWIFQSGATIQSADYATEEEIWSPENSEDTRSATFTSKILRTPNHYGYYTLVFKPNDKWLFSVSGVYTGSMKVAHVIDPETEYTVIKKTNSFYEQNFKAAWNIPLKKELNLQIFAGMQNIFDNFQQDFDIGIERDAGYVYGPIRPRTVFAGLKIAFN